MPFVPGPFPSDDLDSPEPGKIVKVNPANLQIVGEVECTSLDDMQSIIQRAREAQTIWAGFSPKKRRELLTGVQQWVVRNKRAIAKTVCEETGKPRIEAFNVDIMASLSVGDFALDQMERLFKPKPVHLGRLNTTMRLMGRGSYLQARPIGVVGLITPWNYPFGLPYSQAITALATGNAAIVKPSSEAPLSALWLPKAFEESGCPKDLVQVVVGSGGSIGTSLLSSGLDRVIFTGSSEIGREVMAMAAQRLIPVTLELGGKDPFIVLEDADLERAVRCAVWGAFVNAGQTCASVKRIYVQQTVFDRFSATMAHQTSALKMGWGWEDPEVSVGPMINQMALQEVERMVAEAIAQGARSLTGGRRHPLLPGHFFEPTILVDVRQEMEVVQKELFGPVVTIMPFSDETEAVRLAFDCRYALNASIWTRDMGRGKRLAELLPGGTAVINNSPYTFGLAATPWGGDKESGFGRTHGHLGLLDLVEMHHIHWDRGSYHQDIWWNPYDREKLEAGEGMIDDLFSHRGRPSLLKLWRLRRIMRR